VISVSADQNVANVNVVTSDVCPFCDCDPCDCDWGLNELFGTGGSVASPGVASGISGSISYPHTPTIDDLRLPDFDSIFNSFGIGTSDSYAGSYKSTVINHKHKVGDLIRWFPIYSSQHAEKVWMIKKVFVHSPLDCVYYDYEITDGISSYMVNYLEIQKLEEK
jgi:hypothetical protein